MNNLNKIYTIVVTAGEYDSYQSITYGYFADKQKCLEFMCKLQKDVQTYVADYRAKNPASKLYSCLEDNSLDELGFPVVQVSEPRKYSSGNCPCLPGMVGLFQKLSIKYPMLISASSSTGEIWDADGNWEVSVQELPAFE